MPPRKQPRVKQEDADTPVPMKVSRTPTPEVISPTTRRPSAPISTTYHAHPAELPYLTTPSTWSKSRIMQFLLTHSFSIAPRPSHRTYFTTVELANGDKVVIPSVYRVPLLFVGAFLWGSVKLVLQADEASGLKKEWEEFRVGIVHVARVAEAFLEAAKTQGDVDAGEDDLKSKETKGMARMWRCEMFDRVLVRYKLGWLISEPDQLKEFWENYGDEEYAKDPVKTADWKRITTKGVKGFKLTEDQIDDGLTIRQYVDGLKEVDGEWVWDDAGKHTSFRRANVFVESWRKTQVWGKDVRWTTVLAPLKQTAEEKDNDVEMADPAEAPPQISALKAAPKAMPVSAPKTIALSAPPPATAPTPAPKATAPPTAPIPKPSTPAPNDVAGIFRLKKEQREISISQTPFPLPPPSKPASKPASPAKQPTHVPKPTAPAPKQTTTSAKPASSSTSAAASTSTQAQLQSVGYVYPTGATNGTAPKYTSSFSWAPASATFKPTPYSRSSLSHVGNNATPSTTATATTYHQSSISTALQRQLSSSSTVASPSVSSASLIPFASSFSSINPSVPSVVHALTTQDRRVAALEMEVEELKRKLLVREGKKRAVRWDDEDDEEPPAKRVKVTVEPGSGWWRNPLGHLAIQEDVDMQDVSVKEVAKPDVKGDRTGDRTVQDEGVKQKEKEVVSVKEDETIREGGTAKEDGRMKEDGELSPPPESVVNGHGTSEEKGKVKETEQENGTEKEHVDSPLSIRESSIASSVAPPSSANSYPPPPETPSSVASTPHAVTVPLPNLNGDTPAATVNGGGTQDDPMEVDDDDDDSPPPGLGTFGPIKSMRKSMTMGKAGS